MRRRFLSIDEFQEANIVFNNEISKLNEKYHSVLKDIIVHGKHISHLSQAIDVLMHESTGFADIEILGHIPNTELHNEIIFKAEAVFDL